jgi:hypothetical protein
MLISKLPMLFLFNKKKDRVKKTFVRGKQAEKSMQRG